MHVLFVFNHPAPYKVRLFNELSKEIEVTALFERLKNFDRNPLFYNGDNIKFKTVRIKGINFGFENHLSTGIVKHLKSHDYDIVVMNGWHTLSEIFALNYLKKHRKSYVFYINGGIIRPKESHFMKRLKTHYISGADLYFSPDENSNRYLTYYGAEQGKIVNYPYSTIYENEILKQPLTRTEKGSLRSELNIHGTKIFISCGQFIARKNYARLIEYWSNQPSDYTLILIGGGKEKRKYQKLIKKHALQNVILKDFMDKQSLFKYFQAADGYLFPSKEDIYGHVVNEALSQGLPVISNINVNSALCLINNGQNGYIVNFDNDKEISDSIAHVINDEAMPYEALKTARENTIEKMAKRHVTIFKKWVENK